MKIVRLTESDLTRLVKRVIIESKKSKERDYDNIKEILDDKYGIYPNYRRFEEFEDSRFYDSEMSDTEYAIALKDFIQKKEDEEEDEEED
jgi:hypothetical protein